MALRTDDEFKRAIEVVSDLMNDNGRYTSEVDKAMRSVASFFDIWPDLPQVKVELKEHWREVEPLLLIEGGNGAD